MKRTNLVKSLGVAGVAAGAVAAICLSPTASGAPATVYAEPVMNAMQRDLGLTAAQTQERLTQEVNAVAVAPRAKAAAGRDYGGAWFDAATGKLVVGVTDAARAAAVRAAGADAVTVAHTAAVLDAAKAAIDSYAGQTAPKSVTGWYVDEKANSVVVSVKEGARGADLDKFLETATSAGPVRVVRTANAPKLFAGDIIGGDAYFINGSARCSIGFSVEGGFVSAGHCGKAGDSASAPDGSEMGAFEDSSFPGDDYSFVQTNSDFTPTSTVDGYGHGDVTVAGSTAAAVGASICRSGSTTGWHCGTVEAKNQTVNYAEGTVSGLTETDVCAEPGDSGGSWVSGDQAQGVTSGGSGDCTSGGTTFFQPVSEILSAFNLTLITG
jgi:streptogrisin C